MKIRVARDFGAPLVPAFLLLFCFAALPQPSSAAGQAGKTAAAKAAASTQRDRIGLSLTVYNSNLALVRDVRRIQLPSGASSLRFEGIPSSIQPATVQLRSLAHPAKLRIVDQDYEYDQLDPQKLLHAYVGREVTLVQRERKDGSTKWVRTKAILVSDTNGSVWKIGNEIVTGSVADAYRFPDLPANLYSKPTLLWTLDNRGPREQRVEVSYLTGKVNWSADYALTIGRDEKSAGLQGWVTLTNSSGVAYNDAKLQLVAGSVHRAALRRVVAPMAMMARAQAAPAPEFQQQAFSEYHLYTLSQRTSIPNNDSKQISLLSAVGVPVEKFLEVDGQPYYYRNPQRIGNAIPQPVRMFYRFKNEVANGLGMPLPAGTMRVYLTDANGGAEFIGEDTIAHTPKGEAVRVNVGNAFDVVCERKETDYKRLSNNSAEMEYQITLRNHKESAVTVQVREPVGGTWQVENSNYKWTKLDANTIGFEIPVEKNGSATLDYRVRVKW